MEGLAKLTSEYETYAGENVMKEVTMGIMKALEESPEDPIDFLADYLIAKGKAAEVQGEEAARLNFEELLNKCDEMSSRMFRQGEESTYMSRMSFASSR